MSWSPPLTPSPDATLHIWPQWPPRERAPGGPLRAFLNLESWALYYKEEEGGEGEGEGDRGGEGGNGSTASGPTGERRTGRVRMKPFDLGVSFENDSDVQLTYAGVQHTFAAGRQKVISKYKRQVSALHCVECQCAGQQGVAWDSRV